MNLSRAHDRLISLAVSAMITSAFLASAPDAFVAAAAGPQPAAVLNALEGLRAAGFSGTQSLALPAPTAGPQSAAPAPAAAPAPVLLTAVQFAKLDKLTAQHGGSAQLDKAVTDALGLTSGAATLTVTQLDFDTADGVSHGFQRVGDGFIFGTVDFNSVHVIRADAGQQLVAAVSKAHGALTVLPVPQAQKELAAEIAFWASIADQF